MARSVTIAAGKTNVLLPNGNLYQAGTVVTISDADFLRINPTLIPGIVIDGGTVAGGDNVITQGVKVTLTGAAPAALTSAAAVAAPTKVEFDKVVADLVALRASVAAHVVDTAALVASLTGAGKSLSAV